MKRHNCFALLVLTVHIFISCHAQTGTPPQQTGSTRTERIGGPCDGCELMYAGMPNAIDATDTSRGWHGERQKLLVKGTVYKKDGKTPAPGVVLYYWQTGTDGRYTPTEGMEESARRHGGIRGWVQTDAAGRYAIYTIRPMPYPGTQNPAHIHVLVKEPQLPNEYYIDEWVFDDDPFVTAVMRRQARNYGGSGIMKVTQREGLQVVQQNILLGKNIPAYPAEE